MDSLASNPGGSGIYGQPRQDDMLSIVNQLKDREMRDFKDKSNFMSDLSIKQDRLRNRFNFEDSWMNTGKNPGQQQPQQMNTVMAEDPNAMTGYQKGQLGIRQQEMGLDREKMVQQGKMGQQTIDIKKSQEELNQQKSDQIKVQKENELNKKVEMSKATLDQKGETIDNLKTYRDAVEARHQLEIEKKDAAHDADKKQLQGNFDRTHEQMQQKIKLQEQQAEDAKNIETTTELNADGTKKTVTTKKGAKKRIAVAGPNGESGTIEEDDVLPSGWKKK